MPTLWDFSLSFYALPGVAPACIDLQDRQGIDVNVMLFVLWQGCCGGRLLRAEDVARVDGAIDGWRDEVVRPLRAVRRQLKKPGLAGLHPEAGALRTQVQTAELEAERLQQAILERLAPSVGTPTPPSAALALANFEVLLSRHAPAANASADAIRQGIGMYRAA